jgi:hypothetical protein
LAENIAQSIQCRVDIHGLDGAVIEQRARLRLFMDVSNPRYCEEFKVKTVKPLAERGLPVARSG